MQPTLHHQSELLASDQKSDSEEAPLRYIYNISYVIKRIKSKVCGAKVNAGN